MINVRKVRSWVFCSALWSSVVLAGVPGAALPNSGPNGGPSAASAGKLTNDQKIVHLLDRIGYGPRPGDLERVRAMGIARYIELQLHPEQVDDSLVETKLKGFQSLDMTAAELLDKFPRPKAVPKTPADTQSKDQARTRPPRDIGTELQQAKVLRAVYSERQLYEMMVDFWTNHFNIFMGKGDDLWFLTPHDREVIRKNALGKFQDLLESTAKSPAMLFYLDNWTSIAPPGHRVAQVDPLISQARRFLPDRFRLFQPRAKVTSQSLLNPRLVQLPRQPGAEPRPPAKQPPQRRGLNENYARELMELHTLGVDGGYTQKDVIEVARCFTGWTIRQPQVEGTFSFNPRAHDDETKVVLGHNIPAGGGIHDGEMVLDILAHHPSTARFIATKLVRRFISDDPPSSLVDRAAKVFLKTDGDIREVVRTIITSREFFAPEALHAKVKTPLELAVSAIRALGADTDASQPLLGAIARMGEPLFQYQPPTGYPDVASAWMNTGSLLERLNFGLALGGNRLRGTQVDLMRLLPEDLRTDRERLVDTLSQRLYCGQVSQSTRTAIASQIERETPVTGGTIPSPTIVKVIGMALGAPEFQRR